MNQFVIKRNGEYAPFESYKIEEAIRKAFESAAVPFDEKLTSILFEQLADKTTWSVEEVQDKIEKLLFELICLTLHKFQLCFQKRVNTPFELRFILHQNLLTANVVVLRKLHAKLNLQNHLQVRFYNVW